MKIIGDASCCNGHVAGFKAQQRQADDHSCRLHSFSAEDAKEDVL